MFPAAMKPLRNIANRTNIATAMTKTIVSWLKLIGLNEKVAPRSLTEVLPPVPAHRNQHDVDPEPMTPMRRHHADDLSQRQIGPRYD